VRKSIATALGERNGSTPEAKIHAVVYPYSLDIVGGLWGPRQPFVDEINSGSSTMSMGFGTEDDSPSIQPELPTSSKAIEPRVCVEVTASGRVGSSPGREL